MTLFVKEEVLEADMFHIFKKYGFLLTKSSQQIDEIDINQDVVTKIQVTRNLESKEVGFLLLVCPHAVAVDISVNFFEMDPNELNIEDLKDCVSELLNMIGGNLQNSLENASLDMPVLIENEVQLIEIQKNIEKSDFFYEVALVNNKAKLLQLTVYSDRMNKEKRLG